MANEFPQLAFQDWLSRNLDTILRAITHHEGRDAFLSRAVDLADLERRQRAMQFGQPRHSFW